MNGNFVIAGADAFTYVPLSKAEKHVPYGEIVGTTECIYLLMRHRTNHHCYNRVQLY
jgi:hypothetical protein